MNNRHTHPIITNAVSILLGLTIFAAAYVFIRWIQEGGVEPLSALLLVAIPILIAFLAWLRQTKPPENAADLPSTPFDPTYQEHHRIRTALLTATRARIIDDYLTHTLSEEIVHQLNLDKAFQPQALARYRPQAGQPRPIDPNTPILELFNRSSRALLILGQPGSGKTFLLHELATKLLDLARLPDSTEPVPLLLNLATWKAEQPLLNWLIDEINAQFTLARDLAHGWTIGRTLVLLLDGLDEVGADHRAAAVEKINDFCQAHTVDLALTCRTEEYEQLFTLQTAKPPERLRLGDAIELQPLSQTQIDTFLDSTPQLAALRQAIEDDEAEHQQNAPLRELAKTPLMLNLMALTYVGQSLTDIGRFKSLAARRAHLYNRYIHRRLQTLTHSQSKHPYTPRQALGYLHWLAQQMRRLNQTEFFYDRLQTRWLPKSFQTRHAFRVGLTNSLLIFTASSLSLFLVLLIDSAYRGVEIFANPLISNYLALFLSNILLGGAFGILNLLNILEFKLLLIDSIQIQKPTLTYLLMSLLFGLFIGIILSTVFTKLLLTEFIIAVFAGFWFGGLIFLILLIVFSKKIYQYPTVEQTGESLKRTAKNSLFFGVIVGSICLLAVIMPLALFGENIDPEEEVRFWLDISLGIYFGLLIGSAITILYGGSTLINHWHMRRTLAQHGFMPKEIIPFLQTMSRLSLLQQIGGGHRFIHLTLRDHIANLNPNAFPFDD